jgi:hypothetical protein
MKYFRVRIFLALFVCLIPALSTGIAALISGLYNCKLNEGFANPCLVMGTDIGGILFEMGVMSWFMLLTLPAAAVLLIIWIAAELINLVRRRPAA